MKRILIPLDGTRNAEAALLAMETFCTKDDELVLLSVDRPQHAARSGSIPGEVLTAGMAGADGRSAAAVAPDLPHYVETGDQVIQRQLDESRDYLENLAYPLRKDGFHVRIEVKVEADPDQAIIEYARAMQPTFIAMLPRIHPRFNEILFGGAGSRLMRAGVAPVLFMTGTDHVAA